MVKYKEGPLVTQKTVLFDDSNPGFSIGRAGLPIILADYFHCFNPLPRKTTRISQIGRYVMFNKSATTQIFSSSVDLTVNITLK
jgi:hypothetical protein